MAETISWDELRDLARFRTERGCAISMYLNLDPGDMPSAGDVQTEIKSLLDAGERSEAARREDLTHEQRQGLRADFDRIRTYFETEFNRDGAQGAAVFCAGLDEGWHTFSLVEPVEDAIKVGGEFYLAPLVPLIGRGSGALVAMVGREKGQIFRLREGRLEEIVDRSEEQPRRHDQGGWSQKRLQQHADNLALEHLREVAQHLDRLVRKYRRPHVVVICGEELRTQFADALAKESRDAIVGWANADAHATPAELLAVVTPALEGAREEHIAGVLERFREEAGRHGRASTGWAATLEAASDGRVEVLLFAAANERHAWKCPRCGRLAAEAGECPLDGTAMDEHESAIDLVVHQTLAHGGTLEPLRDRQDLDPVEGIGALLRF